jgi:single-strand DNA-binding protein
MPSYNLVVLMGHFTRSPELLYMENGNPYCKFGLAVNETYGKGDNKKQETCFVDVVIFGKQAEFVAQYFDRGHCAIVTARLKQEHWQTELGEKRSRHSLVASSVDFGEAKKSQQEGA